MYEPDYKAFDLTDEMLGIGNVVSSRRTESFELVAFLNTESMRYDNNQYRMFNQIVRLKCSQKKDITGEMIYEGYILAANAMSDVCEVLYLDNTFILSSIHSENSFFSDDFSFYKIIGNIYEDKDIIEKYR